MKKLIIFFISLVAIQSIFCATAVLKKEHNPDKAPMVKSSLTHESKKPFLTPAKKKILMGLTTMLLGGGLYQFFKKNEKDVHKLTPNSLKESAKAGEYKNIPLPNGQENQETLSKQKELGERERLERKLLLGRSLDEIGKEIIDVQIYEGKDPHFDKKEYIQDQLDKAINGPIKKSDTEINAWRALSNMYK